MNLLKNFIISFILLMGFNLFSQDSDKKKLSFDLYEIQIYTGYSINGDHILKMDKDGLILKKNNFDSMKDSETDIVSFHRLISKLEGFELKKFRKNYNSFLLFMDSFDFKNYEPKKQEIDTLIVDGKVQTTEKLISTHDLGTRILIIDQYKQSYFINYNYCDKTLDELLSRINQLIPLELREKYKFRKRCS